MNVMERDILGLTECYNVEDYIFCTDFNPFMFEKDKLINSIYNFYY